MVIKYDEIYNRFLSRIDDVKLISLDEESLYEILNDYLKSTFAIPYVFKLFTTTSFDDELRTLTYTFKNPVNEDSDRNFLIEIISKGMVIAWMTPKIDTALSLSIVLGGKEEKSLKNNYKENMSRLKDLRLELRKIIRDSNYQDNSYTRGD